MTELTDLSMPGPRAPLAEPQPGPEQPDVTPRKKSFLTRDLGRRRVKREEVMHFSRQLAAFLRAGIPILDAMTTLGAEASNPRLREVLTEIVEGVRTGRTLSECVGDHPDVFPEVYRGILHSAELTGRLDSVLDQLAEYLERDLEARRRIRAAMIYPIVILVMSVVTVVVLTLFVLPRFEVFFENLDAELPLPTRMLLATTGFLGHWWWLIALLGALVTTGLVAGVRTERGRWWFDSLKLDLPLLGLTVRYAVIERFCRVLASMVQAGVPLPEAMSVATETTRNVVYAKALAGARDEMLRGEGLARPIANTGMFTGTAVQMIRVGEETGSLDTQLEVAGGFYARELDYMVKRLTTLFEPAVIIVMGLIVGFVAIALVSAMYGIFDSAGGL